MTRFDIPVVGPVGVTENWACLDCDATGGGPTSDKDAAKHNRTTRHSTRAWTRPKEPRT